MTAVADLASRWNADWGLLCEEPSHAARVADWLVEAGVFAPAEAPGDLADVLAELERRDRERGRSHSDLWLAALLQQAAAAEPAGRLAARVVVQAMLPSALRTARSLQQFLPHAEARTIAVSALYETVLRYPLARRPQRIAANLALDTLRTALREARRDGLGLHVPLESVAPHSLAAEDLGPAELAEVADLADAASMAGLAASARSAEQLAGAYGEVVELLLWAQRTKVLGGQALAAITGHYRDGAPLDREAARAAGVSELVWRKRRSRAVSQLRQAVPQWRAEGAA